LLGFTRSLARELARFQIRVNAVCPGAIDTPMTRAVPEAALKGIERMTPLGRLGEAHEIAAAVLYLASDDASYVSGAELLIDGGALAQ
jgi:3-oxoacyl-[acyl-carrier protein] reductase